MFHTKSGAAILRDGAMDYIRFGSGARVLIMPPGPGNFLRTVKGTALPMAAKYLEFTR